MPRKKKQQSGKPVVGASGKHSKHRNHASDGPIGKAKKDRDKEGGRQQSLRYLQEMFSGKLDPMVVHMIMEDYNYNVDLALEVLFPLSGDAGDKERFEEGAKTALVGYNDSEEESEDEEEECEDPAGAGSLVGGRSEGDNTRTSSTGVGLDDFSIPLSKVKGLDMAIILADQLDRNTFAEESVQQILKGFKAYQRSGDRKVLEQLGNLSAIGEMLLEKGVAEEEKKEKEAVQAAKVKVKHVHSRLPVYSVTDDRLIGGMSSCSSSESDSAQASGDEDDRGNDNPTPLSKSNGTAVGGSQSSEWYDQQEAQHEDSTAQLGTKTECEHDPDEPDKVWTGSSDVTSHQASSRPDSTGGALLVDSRSCETSKAGSIKDAVRSRAAKESSDFGLNESVKFTDNRSITNKYEEQNSHTPTQDITLESFVVQDNPILNKPERTMEWQTSERIPAEPKTQPRKSHSLDETFTLPSSHREHVVFPPNTQSAFMSQGPAVSHPARFIPAFGFNTLDFSKANITTGLLPRVSPYNRSQFTLPQGKVHDNPAYSDGFQQTSIFQDSFGGQYPKSGFHPSLPPYSAPPVSSVGMPPQPGFTPMPNMEVPRPYFDQIDKQVVEPIFTSTMAEEEMGSPQRWPMIPHTNLKRSQLPSPSPSQKTPPQLPPGKVLCLMRGCPGSGKSFLARKLVGNGVILSTDDYFMVNGEYQYDIQQVGEAHDRNRERAKEHLEKGTTPIIIDNTNIMRWEMKPYVAMALKHEYQVVFMESDSPWRNKVGELAKRNSHGVPRGAIARMLQNFEHNVTVESVMNAPDKKKQAEDVHDLYAERTGNDKRNGKKPEKEGEQAHEGREGRENIGEGVGTKNQNTGGNKDVSVTEDGSEESAWETVGKKKVEHTRGHRGNQKNGQRTRGGRGGENHRGSPHRGSPKRRGQNRDRTHDMGKQPEPQRLGDSPKRYGMKRNNQSSPGPEADRHQQGRQARVRSSPRKGTKVGGKNAEQSPKLEKRNVSQISQGERGFPADKPGHEREALSQFEEAVEFLANTESIDDPMTRLMADIRTNSRDAGTASAREADNMPAAWTDDNPWQVFPSHPSQKSVQYSKRSQGRRRETAITKTSSNITHSSRPAEANPLMNVEDIEQESCDRVSKTQTGRSQQNVSEEIKPGKTGGVEEKSLPLTDWSDGEINGDFHLNEWEIDHNKPRPARKVDQRNKQRKTDSNNVHQDASPIKTAKLDDINQPPDRLTEQEFSSEVETCKASPQEEQTDQFGAQKALKDCHADLGAPNGESSDKVTSSQVHQSARCTTPSQGRAIRRSSSGGKSSRRIAAVFTSPAEVPKVDWSINDPSKSIPKPTFPVSRQESVDQEKDVKAASTMTDAKDFVILHNVVNGSSSISDLPTGYSFKSVTITPQDNRDTEFLLEGNDGGASVATSSPSSSPIPHSLKLHKSCMTEEIEDVDTSEEDKVAMMKVCFPDASPSDLESILDTCKGDVQWATNILLDSYASANISPVMGGEVVEAASDVGNEAVSTNMPLNSLGISSEKEAMAHDQTKCAAQHDISENDKRLGQVNEGEGSEVEKTRTDKVEQSHGTDSESLPRDAHGRVDNSDGNREGVEQVAGDNVGIETNNRFSDDDHVEGSKGAADKECSQHSSEHDLTAPKILTTSAEEHSELTLGKGEQSDEVIITENVKESKEQSEDDEGESSSSEEFSNNFATGVTETSCSKISTRCDTEVICSETSTSHDTGTISSKTSTSCDNEAIHSKTLTVCDAEVICSKTPSSYVTETICSKIAGNSETTEDDMPELESSVDAQMMRNKLAALSDKSGIGGVGYLVKIADTHNQASLGTGSVVSQSSNAAVVCEDGVSRTDEKEDSNTRRDEVGTSDEQTCQHLPEGSDKNETPKVTHEGIPGEIVISDRSGESTSTPPGRCEEDAVLDGAASESLTRTIDAHLSSCVRPFDEIEKVTRQGDTLPVVVENRRDLSDSLCTPDFDSTGGINASELREGQSNTSAVCSGLFSTVSGMESMVPEVSDSDIPWKEEYISPEEKTPKDDGKEKDAIQDPQGESGRSVYDYFGGMVLQMDAAFALQLQELFGPVGFHMQPDALSDDDLKVSIDYTTAKKLHAALSQGLKERFQSQETHLEDMLKRDEELARRLQQEENLKKLVKSHKNKTGKAVAPWSPKTRKKKEVAGIGGVTGRGMGQMGEGELTGRIQPPPVQRTVVPELAKIMAEEEEKEQAEKQEIWSNGNQERGSSIATKLKREQLYETYPDVDKSVLEELFKANSYDLRHTIWEVNAVYREPAEPVKNVYSPGALERMQRRRQNSPARQKVDGEDSSDGQFQSREQPDYDDYRAEASLHYRQRDECFKKAAKAYHSGQKELALHYSNQGRLHSMKLKEANRRAAELIVQQRRQETGEDKLDLHNLHLEEALQVLQEVLLEKEQQWGRRRVDHGSPSQNRYLEVVTGRGKHSHGGVAKLKPAVETFLQQRGYRFSVTNAGCFRVYLQ